MSKNQYYTDIKYTVWVRTIFNVKARNDKEANEIAKQILEASLDPYDCDDVDVMSTEQLEGGEKYAGEKQLFKVNKYEDELIMEVKE